MREESIRAKKSLGQNFLIDHEALSDIASAIDIAGKHIIEVGPGYGALTEYLLAFWPLSLDLVELDDDMIPLLSEKFAQSVTIHHQDVLSFIPQYESYSLVANIPYYITSPILFHFLYHVPQTPLEMVIMMQREVGEKILALSKKRHYSLLSLALYEACESIEAIRLVPRTAFRPAPKVESIVLRFRTKQKRDPETEKKLIHLWKQAFSQPRKTLLSNLRWLYDETKLLSTLTSLGYDARVRAEAIEREDWKKFL
jgi:16S rRNA (adenine1518-N6/adenine1519-N6)-dimethyltransferase